MFKYYNANPLNRKVNDCTVRAISLANNKSWDETYIELSEYARKQANMPDDVEYIDSYLKHHYEELCGCRGKELTVGEFVRYNREGTFLITMRGHITCCINGCIYDIFDPSDSYVWGIYKVK